MPTDVVNCGATGFLRRRARAMLLRRRSRFLWRTPRLWLDPGSGNRACHRNEPQQVHSRSEPSIAPPTVHRMTAFVTRGDGRDHELLLFRHPTARIQLPAGTVEVDEAIEAAAARKVWEESGLACLIS